MRQAGRWIARATSMVATVVVAACGGGDDAPSPPPVDVLSGIWVGTTSEFGDGSIALVDGSDFTVFRPGRSAVLHGFLSSRSGTIDSRVSSLTYYTPPRGGTNGYPMSLSGTASPRGTMTATGTDSHTPPSSVSLSLRYDAGRYERPASLARIAGAWRDGTATSYVEWRIDASTGELTGSDSNGCAYSGRVTVPEPTRNLYRIEYDRYRSPTDPRYEPACYGGLGIRARAFLDDGAAPDDTLRSAGLLPGALVVKGDAHVENLVRR